MISTQLLRGLLSRSVSNVPVASTVAPTVLTKLTAPFYNCNGLHTSATDDAARKGTRARREAIKKANKKKKLAQEGEQKKKEFIPFSLRESYGKGGKVSPRKDYSWMKVPPEDDVYVAKYFQWKINSITEALEMHRESHQPSMYNYPDAHVYLYMELSMLTDKKNRFLDKISNVIKVPHHFPMGAQRQVAVISDQQDVRTRAQEMGAHLVGGKEIVKLVMDGEIDLSLYDHVVASLEILPDLVPIRGLLKRSFPNPRNGTAVADVAQAVDRFMHGLKYDVIGNKFDPDYAHVEMLVGTLEMTDEAITENIECLVKDIDSHRGTRKTSDVITTAYLKCPPTNEMLPINANDILTPEEQPAIEATASN